MFPTFFIHKMREVKSFLQIMRGKATGNNEDRIKGVDKALNAMKDEKRVYLNEKRQAERDEPGLGVKEDRESNRDISAI